MIPLDMREEDVRGRQALRQLAGDRRKVPPRSPLGAAQQPRIYHQCDGAMLNVQASVREEGELHDGG